jgi:hypothetical protein
MAAMGGMSMEAQKTNISLIHIDKTQQQKQRA